MAESERPLPEPMTPETRPYWEGLRKRRLMLPTCGRCGPFFYPRPYCPRCHRPVTRWIKASGRGRLHAFEIAHQAFDPAFKVKPPYVLAMIELDEGPRLMSNLIGIAPDPRLIRCDMPVEVVFRRLDRGVVIPLFKPAPERVRRRRVKAAAGRRR